MTEDMAERFGRDTAAHRMTVLRDDGLYRHLRFRNPKSSEYWFDLITWPGCLTINGDMGAFTFARTKDMFELFRSRYGINPGYWDEKIRAAPRGGTKVYSDDQFRRVVLSYFSDAVRSRSAPPGLADAIRKEVLGSDHVGTEEDAHAMLAAFEYGVRFTAECAFCGDRREEADDYLASKWRIGHQGHGHDVTITRVEGFRFHDSWECNLREWSYQYLWCCHAIQWGIGQYDAQRASAEAAAYQENERRSSA